MLAAITHALSASDLLQLVALMFAAIFGLSYLFQRAGEEKVRRLVGLRRDVELTVGDLRKAIEDLRTAQHLSETTIERLVTCLDVVAVDLESNGGVICELLSSEPNLYPEYERAHCDLLADLRGAVDELRVLSPNRERRVAALKNLAFAQANYRALEAVEAAALFYPDDDAVQSFALQLSSHLRETGSAARY